MLSIIIPNYNSSNTLRDIIESVQSYDFIKLIVIDDGSDSNNKKVLSELNTRHYIDKIIFQENAGPGAARNKGLEYVTTEYFCFLDADDNLEWHLLKEHIEYMQQSEIDLLLFDSKLTGINSQYIDNRDYQREIPSGVYSRNEICTLLHQKKKIIVQPCMFILKSEKFIHLRFPLLPRYEDNAYFAYILSNVNLVKTMVVDKKILIHRLHQNSLMGSAKIEDKIIYLDLLIHLNNISDDISNKYILFMRYSIMLRLSRVVKYMNYQQLKIFYTNFVKLNIKLPYKLNIVRVCLTKAIKRH